MYVYKIIELNINNFPTGPAPSDYYRDIAIYVDT